jgi:hypothetical protein
LWWSTVFAGFFANFGVQNVGFLRGKRGEVVVNCVAGSDSKRLAEARDSFFAHLRVYFCAGDSGPVSSERLRDPNKKKGRPEGRPLKSCS